jgi:hypothetical protein
MEETSPDLHSDMNPFSFLKREGVRRLISRESVARRQAVH